jgi:hypothetical protein
VRVAALPAGLVALGGEPALELHHHAVHGGEVLQRARRQGAVELVQRPRRRQCLRALDLRALELAAQVLLEAPDLLARERLARRLGLVLLHRAAGLRAQTERAADALHVDAEHARALPAAAEGGDRQPREIAHRRLVALADGAQDLLAQVVEVDPLAVHRGPVLLARAGLAHAAAQRLALGGAEEEALEHEVEHPPVLGRLGQRGGHRLPERGRVGPLDLRQRRERVVELGRPDRHALGPQLLGEAQDVGGDRHGRQAAAPSRTPTRSATVSRSVRCLTMIDSVERKTSASMSSAPISSSARAQSIDSAIDGGFLRSSSRTIATTSTSRRATVSGSSGACRRTISSSWSMLG